MEPMAQVFLTESQLRDTKIALLCLLGDVVMAENIQGQTKYKELIKVIETALQGFTT